MRKLVVVLLCFASFVCLSGCAEKYAIPSKDTTDESVLTIKEIGVNYKVFVHNETGVYYVRFASGGVTPLFNADGTLFTGQEASDNE